MSLEAEMEKDMREQELAFALRLMRGMTTYEDATEYLVSCGWAAEEVAAGLGASYNDSN